MARVAHHRRRIPFFARICGVGASLAPVPDRGMGEGRGVGAPVCDPPLSPLPASRFALMYATLSSLPSLIIARNCTPRVLLYPYGNKGHLDECICCVPDWLVYGARPLPTGEGGQSDAHPMASSSYTENQQNKKQKELEACEAHSRMRPAPSAFRWPGFRAPLPFFLNPPLCAVS